MRHPAYVRLALVSFATPGGGMDYVKLAAGGSFKENFFGGPLAAMHGRLRKLVQAGVRACFAASTVPTSTTSSRHPC